MLPKLIKLFAVLIITFIVLSFLPLQNVPRNSQINFGVTFSPKYARFLGLDFQKTYIQILDELKVRNLRLPSYWDNLEKEKGIYDFADTDFLLNEAEKRGARVLLVVGARQPRWPECHYPDWSKKLSVTQRQEKTLEFIQKVVERYRDNSAIWAYQVENEPFAWWFGEGCDKPDAKFLQQEVVLVKKLDPKKLIVITDSGESGFWVDSIANADILGSSIYRKSYNSLLKMYIPYPFPAGFYRLKAKIVTKLPNQQNKKVIVSELQSEPWLANITPEESTPKGQAKLFSLNDFKQNMEFVKEIGFEENYLWGVEWWYWMEKQGYPQYLDFAKTIF